MEHPLNDFKYCPKCGSKSFNESDVKSKLCSDCGFHYYFNPSAAVVGFIVNSNGELLVCKRSKEPAKGTLDITGGFVDCNETAEEAIIREVKEETELDVVNLKYLFSIPNIYRFSNFNVHTLDIFFLCQVESSENPVAHDDVESCYFISLDKVRPEDFGLDSIRKGVQRFITSLALSPLIPHIDSCCRK